MIEVVIGNPPYNGKCAGSNAPYKSLVLRYQRATDGLVKMTGVLTDDYIKFIAFAQKRIESAGAGVVAYITNSGFLKLPASIGVRKELLKTFDSIYILDLKGNSRDEANSGDENIFGIKTGVCIFFCVKRKDKGSGGGEPKVFYTSITGKATEKLEFLEKTKTIYDADLKEIANPAQNSWVYFESVADDCDAYLFVRGKEEYDGRVVVFKNAFTGVYTGDDTNIIKAQKTSADDVEIVYRPFIHGYINPKSKIRRGAYQLHQNEQPKIYLPPGGRPALLDSFACFYLERDIDGAFCGKRGRIFYVKKLHKLIFPPPGFPGLLNSFSAFTIDKPGEMNLLGLAAAKFCHKSMINSKILSHFASIYKTQDEDFISEKILYYLNGFLNHKTYYPKYKSAILSKNAFPVVLPKSIEEAERFVRYGELLADIMTVRFEKVDWPYPTGPCFIEGAGGLVDKMPSPQAINAAIKIKNPYSADDDLSAFIGEDFVVYKPNKKTTITAPKLLFTQKIFAIKPFVYYFGFIKKRNAEMDFDTIQKIAKGVILLLYVQSAH